MQKNFTNPFNQLLTAAVNWRKSVAIVSLLAVILSTAIYLRAAIISTPVPLSVSSDKAWNGPAAAFTPLNKVIVKEESSDDFKRNTSGDFILTAPAGWVFKSSGVSTNITNIGGTGSTQVNVNTGGITYSNPDPNVTQPNSTIIRIPYTVSSDNRLDQIEFLGLEVMPVDGNNLTPGNVQFTVSNTANVVGALPIPVATLTQTLGLPYKLAFETQPGGTNTSLVGDNLVNQPQVRFLDYFSRPLNTGTSSVSLSISAGTTTAVLTGSTTNAVNGLATFSGVKIDVAGTNYKLTATSSLTGGTTSVESVAFIVSNKLPTISSLSSNCGTAGTSADLPITITGANFVPGAIVRFTNNNTNVATDFGGSSITGLTSTQLTVTVPSTYVQFTAAGNYSVQVVNPFPVQDGTPDTEPFTFYPLLSTGSISGNANVCAGAPNEVYSISLVAGATSYNWNVPAGATITSTVTNTLTSQITVNFGTATSGNVSVAAVNPCGTAGPASTLAVTVNQFPAASISAPNGTQSCNTVRLEADLIAGASYEWLLNGNSIGALNQNVYDAPVSGRYSVRVTNNNCPAVSNTIDVIILSKDNIIINGPIASFCAGDNVTLLALEGDRLVYTYKWFIGTTELTGQTSRSLIVSTPGDYSLELTVPATATTPECVITATTKVVELAGITDNIITTPFQVICENTPPFQIGGPEPNGGAGPGTYKYQWQSSTNGINYNNISGAEGQNYIPASSLTQTTYFQRVVTSGSCSDISNAVQITVTPLIVGNTITTPEQTICTGSTLEIVAAVPTGGAGSYTYRWQSSTDGTSFSYITPPATDPNYNYDPGAFTGTILFRREASSGGCISTSDPVAITVAPRPVADAGTDQRICSNGSIRIGTAAVAGLAYNWSPSTGLSSITDAQPTVTLTNTTTAAVTQAYTLTVTNPVTKCVSVVDEVIITVDPLPQVTFNTTFAPLCVNSAPITLTGGSPTGGTYTGTGVSNGQFNPSIAGDGFHTITYTYTDPTTTCKNTATQIITVNPLPVADAGPAKTICSSGSTTNNSTTIGTAAVAGLTYSWSPATGLSDATAAQPTVTLSNTGTTAFTQTYSLTVTANGCASAPSTVEVTVNPQPQVDFTIPGNRTTFFTGEGNITLTPVVAGVTNPGGTFTVRNTGAQPADIISGAIVNGNQFSPCAAGAGSKIIRYTYTNSNNCTAFAEKTVTVNQSTYSVIVISNPKPFCRGVNVAHTAFVYRDAQVEYPYLVNSEGQAVRADMTTLIGKDELPIANPNFSKTQGATQAVKDNAFRFYDPIVTGGTEITSGITYQWGKNQSVEIGADGKTFGNAGLSSLEYYAATVTVSSTTTCGPNFTRLSTRAYTGALPDYNIVLSVAPNPICPGDPLTLTAALDPDFPYWGSSNLVVNWMITRGGTTTTFATSSYNGTNFIRLESITGPGGSLGNFQNGDQISVTYTTDIDRSYSGSKCGGDLVTNVLTINVNQPPTATALANTTVCTGGTATFRTTAGGTGPFTYQWFKGASTTPLTNGGNISGASTNTLTISTVSASDAGDYRVQVSGVCPPSAGSTATLTVNPATVFTSHPEPGTTTVCAGANFTLSAAAIGTGTLTYRWYRGTTPVSTTDPRITGATSTTLVISGVTAADAGTYTLQASGTCPTVSSLGAVLNVDTPPAVSQQPQVRAVCPGAGTTFSVTATGTPTLTYQWLKDGAEISAAVNPSAATSTLNLSGVTANDVGTYSVRISNICAPNGIVFSIGTLSLNTLATTTDPDPVILCSTGGTATFSVTAGGTGPFAYKWFKGNTALSNSSGKPEERKIDGVDGPKLTIRDVQSGDVGDYRVEVTGACSMVSSKTAALILGTPTTIAAAGQPQPTAVCPGGTTTFSVTTTGTPPTGGFIYQWFKGTSTTPMIDGGNISGATTSTLTISNASAGDVANYSVKVTGACSSPTSSTAALTLNNPKAIATQPVGTSICAGTPTTLSVAATGSGTLTYQWYKKLTNFNAPLSDGGNITGTQTATLSFTNTTTNEAGTYYVVVGGGVCDPASVESEPALLTVNPILANTVKIDVISPANGEVVFGSSVTYKATSSIANTNETYTWYVAILDSKVDNSFKLQTDQNGNAITGSTFTLNPVPEGQLSVRVDVAAASGTCVDKVTATFATQPLFPLPVEMLYFTAEKKQNNLVVLEWATAMEKLNEGFQIEVSQDAVNYRTLSFVPTKNGNTTAKQVYTFHDKENGKYGTRYYRIKQMDVDGTSEYFGPKAVTMDELAEQLVAYPNPFSSEINLEVNAEAAGSMHVIVSSAVGAKVLERTLSVQKGSNKAQLQLNPNLPLGMYIITTRLNGKTNHFRLMKK